MKILVATKRTQGIRKNDFCFVPEGEPLMAGFECDRETVDGGCGCRRSLVGVECLKATSTMLVTDVAQDREWLLAAYGRGMRKAGFKLTDAALAAGVDEMLGIAVHFEAGTVIERRGNRFQARKV